MTLRLIQQVHLHARQRPLAIAIEEIGPRPAGNRTITYSELRDRVEALSADLRRRWPGGAVIVLCCSNRVEFTISFLAILAAGMTVFPVAPDTAPVELRAVAEAAGAAAMIARDAGGTFTESSSAAAIDPLQIFGQPNWPVRQDPGAAMLLQSSGTTARPKMVRRDGAALDAVSDQMVEAVGFTTEDRVLACVPLCHSYGVEHGLLAPMWAGSRVQLGQGFDLQTVHAALAGVTLFPGVPFMFEMLAGTSAEMSRVPLLRKAYSAGGVLPLDVARAFEQRFGTGIGQVYGATEIGSVTFNDPRDPAFNPASVGLPMRGVSIRILDVDSSAGNASLEAGAEGQVAIAAHSMLGGYRGDEPVPQIDGHFLTGDLGRLDARGALTITGRLKLLIDVGGRKVNPAEVEEVLMSHPDVGSCVVVPVQVSQTLYRLKAVVTPARQDREPSVLELRQFARQRLTGYKVPRLFEIRDALPRSSTGKILRHQVEAS